MVYLHHGYTCNPASAASAIAAGAPLSIMARSLRPRLHTRRCLGLALPADPTAAALGRHRPACAMRCDPATANQPASRLPCSAELPPTMPAPTRLHPNPLGCPDRSIITPQLPSAHIHAAICLPTRSFAPASRCLSTMPHTRRIPNHHSASPYTLSQNLFAGRSST